MSTPLDAFNPFVMPWAKDTPQRIAQFHVRQAAIEFCRRTLIWRKTLPAVSSTIAPLLFNAPLANATSAVLASPFTGATADDYVLIFSDGSRQTARLMLGGLDVSWLNPVTSAPACTYAARTYPFPVTPEATVAKLLKFSIDGEKCAVLNPDMGEDIGAYGYQADGAWTTDRLNFTVTQAPTRAGIQYGLVVALNPSQEAESVPDDVFAGHAEDIAAGALARILGLPDKDMAAAQGKRAYFERRMGIVAAQAAKGFGRGRSRVKAHFF